MAAWYLCFRSSRLIFARILGLGRLAVGPVHGQVGADPLDEFVRDLGELGVGLHVLDAACERVVERRLFLAESELLVAVASVAELLGDLDEPLDDLCACELLQLVALQHRANLLAEHLRLHLVGCACGL